MSLPSRARVEADAGLVEALRRGDADAVEQLVQRHGVGVYRLALRITGASEDAEAVAAEALREATRRIDAYEGEPAFGTWIHRIAAAAAYRTLSVRHLGAGKIALDDVLPALDADGRHFEPMHDWSERVGEGPLRGELRRIMSDAIAALPADYLTAFVLHDVEGMSSANIAATLGISPPDVKARVHRSRLFVRKRLSEHLETA